MKRLIVPLVMAGSLFAQKPAVFMPSSGGGAVSSVNGQTGAVVVDAANLPASLKITYTGTPQTALVLPFSPGIAVVPVAAVSGQQTYTAGPGPVIAGFAYSESNATTGNTLLTLSFDDLVGVGGIDAGGGTFVPVSMARLTSLSAPELLSVGGGFGPLAMPLLTTFNFPKLAFVGGAFSPGTMAVLASLSFPELVSVGKAFSPSTLGGVTTFSFPKLKYIGGNCNPNSMGALVVLSLPVLERIGANFNPATMAACTTVSLPAMVSYVGTVAIPSASMANVASFTMGTVGTLKSINGATITLSGLKLPSANVNAILALLVSLDGTNGTTLWGAGKTLTINGGTNGAPTGQGIIDKATLIARTATVTTN